MLHLALVHNIMTAIGGAPHLARVNMPAQANHYPAGVQLALLPFGEQALRHFMFLERPEGMDIADADGLAAVGRAEPLMAEHDIVPRLQDFATVGHLYRSIEAGLARLAEKFGEKGLFIGPPRAQATSANFHWPELIPVTDLASACRAVGEILEQGEGPRGHWENAHFGQFVQILDEYQQMRQANPSFDPVRPVLAANVRPLEHGDVPLITDDLTARCMDLFNVGYEILLLALERYFAHTEETDAQLETLAELTIGLMFSVIKPLGDLITTLPAGSEYEGRTAGPSFELFYEADYLIPHRGAAWAMLEERMREAADFAGRLRTVRAPAEAVDEPAAAEAVAQALVPVGESLIRLADSLAAHFPEWGAVSRWAPAAAGPQQAAATPADLNQLLAQAADLTARAAAGPYADLATSAYAAAKAATAATASSAVTGAALISRLVHSVLRPLAAAAPATSTPPAPTATTPSATPASATGTTAVQPLAAQLRELALAAARLRVSSADPALLEASAALQDLACKLASDEAAVLDELRLAQAELAAGITVATDGPYLVTNAEKIRNWLGEDTPVRPQLALCRCGESAIKPFCDGSHATNGFSGAKDPKRVPDHRDVYPGQQLTIFDNRGICQHSGFCTDRLSSVFHAGRDPFVTPAGGRADDVVAAIRACPSGALSFAVDDVEERGTVDYHGTREQAIEVSKDGPYRITGGLPLVDGAGEDVPRAEGSSPEHYALCRCGHSQNKPFCSGMHWYVSFTDPAPSAQPTLFEWAGGLPALTALARSFYEKHVPADPVLASRYASASPGQAKRAAARLAEAFGGPRPVAGAAATLAPSDAAFSDRERGHWTALWLHCADEVKLPADPEFRSAFAAYIAWESAAPAGAEVPRWDWGAAGTPSATTSVGTGTAAGADTTAGAGAVAEPELPGPGEPVSFAQHIKPLFREKDRKSMSFAFDLWSYADVRANAAGILERIRNGSMPCDGAWPAEKAAVFQRWTESGTPV
jgi:CDGSH-type Zn-finger protein/truncated hemoglobin YjbI